MAAHADMAKPLREHEPRWKSEAAADHRSANTESDGKLGDDLQSYRPPPYDVLTCGRTRERNQRHRCMNPVAINRQTWLEQVASYERQHREPIGDPLSRSYGDEKLHDSYPCKVDESHAGDQHTQINRLPRPDEPHPSKRLGRVCQQRPRQVPARDQDAELHEYGRPRPTVTEQQPNNYR